MDQDVEFFIKKFDVSRETIEKLNKYKDFLISSNKILSLIGKTTENHIFSRHFIDSAQIYDLIEYKSEIIDLGSGAGFPGVILKILMDYNKKFGNITLIEKCGILKQNTQIIISKQSSTVLKQIDKETEKNSSIQYQQEI